MLALPKIPGDSKWKVKICSGDIKSDIQIKDKQIKIAPRTIAVLVCKF